MADTDTIPTMVVRPKPTQDGQGGTKPGATEWDGRKLSYGDMVNRWKARGYSDAGARGIADNMTRESGGNPTAIGPGGAAIGLFQHEGPRRTALEKFAKARGTSPTDPDTQIDFADRELRTQYPKLREQLVSGTDRGAAEDQFKRVFERPASVLWGENRPKTESPDYRYSPYAMNEHAGRKNTDIVYMRPQDYLDLAPDLEEKPFTSPAGRSLLASVDKGEPIEAIPTLGMKVKGNTGEITEQDGRHRALLAQHAGLDAIPVAITKTGRGDPTEIEGMSGKIMPNNFPKAADVKKPDRAAERTDAGERSAAQSLWSKAAQAISPIGRAEAAEPQAGGIARTERPSDDGWEPVPEQPSPAEQGQSAAAPGQDGWEPVPTQSPQDDQQAAPDGMLMSAVKGAGAGLGRTVLAGQEMVGQGLKAAGATDTGKWLVDDARRGIGTLEKELAPDQEAHPNAVAIGDFGGSMAIPGGGVGLGAKIVGGMSGRVAGNALKAGLSGGLSGLLQPGSDENYWTEKAEQGAAGSVAGLTGNALLGWAGRKAGQFVLPLKDAVKKLMNEGVELTPGQMKGGVAKALEDKAMSVPITGDAIKTARRRGIEQFNRAAMNRALGEVGLQLPPGVNAGHDAIEMTQTALNNEYDRVLTGVRLHADPTYQADIANLRSLVGEMPPDRVAQFDNIYRNRVAQRLGNQMNMDGATFKQVESELTMLANGFRRSRDVADQQLGSALNEVKASLRDALERSNPGKRAEIAAANRGYAMLSRVEEASMRRVNGDGVFSPADLWQAIRTDATRSGRRKAFARGDAMMQDLANAGQTVLPSTVPDSGTWGRALFTGAAAQMMHHPEILLGLVGGAAPWVRPVNSTTNAMIRRLAQQPGPTRNALAEILRRAGPVTAPAAGSLAASEIPSMTIRPGDR